MKKFKIDVTYEDLRMASLYGRESNCPIATAIRRKFHVPCWVEYKILRLEGGISRRLPKIASDFIEKFDDRKTVSPITFYVNGW